MRSASISAAKMQHWLYTPTPAAHVSFASSCSIQPKDRQSSVPESTEKAAKTTPPRGNLSAPRPITTRRSMERTCKTTAFGKADKNIRFTDSSTPEPHNITQEAMSSTGPSSKCIATPASAFDHSLEGHFWDNADFSPGDSFTPIPSPKGRLHMTPGFSPGSQHVDYFMNFFAKGASSPIGRDMVVEKGDRQ